MNQYRYALEKYQSGGKNRYTCPSCGKRKKYTRYIDKETGNYLPEEFGKCERLNNCGYHVNPYKTGYAKEIWQAENEGRRTNWKPRKHTPKPPLKPKPSYISETFVTPSLQAYDANNFVQHLTRYYGQSETMKAVKTYGVGTSQKWQGSTVFWQRDYKQRVRSGKIILYRSNRMNREKKRTTWVHSELMKKGKLPDDFNLVQCFFGEHLLSEYPTKPIAIVESEKTALVCSIEIPDFLWIATGSMSNLKGMAERCKELKNRSVTLYPDLGEAYEKWQLTAIEFGFDVSEYLNNNTPEADKREGYDIADYLLKDKEPRRPKPTPEPPPESEFSEPGTREPNFTETLDYVRSLGREVFYIPSEVEDKLLESIFINTEPEEPKPEPLYTYEPKPECTQWQDQVEELRNFFASVELPDSIRLSQSERISDVPKFVDSHLAMVEANDGNETYRPYLDRLQKVRDKLQPYH